MDFSKYDVAIFLLKEKIVINLFHVYFIDV